MTKQLSAAARKRPGSISSGETRRLGRPPGQSSDDTRRAIMTAARESFAKLGFERSTNREIAAAAGVTAAAMYRHFESKPDLYAAVVQEATSELVPVLRTAVAQQVSARAAFRALVLAQEAFDDRQRTAAGFLAELPTEMQRHPQVAARMLADPGEVYTILNAIVDLGVRSGEIPVHKAQRAVSVMIASFMGITAYANTLGPSLGKQATAGFLDLIDDALFCRP